LQKLAIREDRYASAGMDLGIDIESDKDYLVVSGSTLNHGDFKQSRSYRKIFYKNPTMLEHKNTASTV
jgi:hypothetical protein